MANPFKNEKEIVLCGESILLRPTFENMANMETKVGSLGYLSVKVVNFGDSMRELVGFSELASIIYWNQAAHDRSTGFKLRTIHEIFEMVSVEGIWKVIPMVAGYLAGVAKGNTAAPELTDSEKKS